MIEELNFLPIKKSSEYPKEYRGPKPIANQIKGIARIFDLDPSQAIEYAKHLPDVPASAEGWFAVPSSNAIAVKHFPEVTDPAEKNCKSLHLVCAKIAELRPFFSRDLEKITPERLRVCDQTARKLELIEKTQPGDILIIAAQLGMHYLNYSVSQASHYFARERFGQFALGIVMGGAIILTHPERFVFSLGLELGMCLPGDEFSWQGDNFCFSPAFCCYGRLLKLYMESNFNPSGKNGVVTSFLPRMV